MLSRPLADIIPNIVQALSITAACIAIIFLVIAIWYYEKKEGQRSPWFRRIFGSILGGAIIGSNVWNVAFIVYGAYILYALATGHTALPSSWSMIAWTLGSLGVLVSGFIFPRWIVSSSFSLFRSWCAALRSTYIFLVGLVVVSILVSFVFDMPVGAAHAATKLSLDDFRVCLDCHLNIKYVYSIIEDGNGFMILKEAGYSLLAGVLVQVLGIWCLRSFLRTQNE